jgi:dihydroorotase
VKSLLIAGGRVIDPAKGLDGAYDVLVVEGSIEAVEPPGRIKAPDGAAALDADGMWVMPGLIDPHVHLRDPGFPEKETISTGLRAAAAGGFTAVAAMANTSPVNDDPEITRYMLARAKELRATGLIPVSAVTKGLAGKELVDFAAMAGAGARLFSDDGVPIDDLGLMAKAAEQLARFGFAISLHEEDRALSQEGAANAGEISKRLGVRGYPVSAESRRIRRDLALAIGTGFPLHLAHVSCAESLDLVRRAKQREANVTCEVTPHHFTLDETALLTWGPNAKMNPPLRSREDVDSIRAAIADGTIDMIATDHAPHDASSKQLDRLAGCFPLADNAARFSSDDADAFARAANGVIGLETSLGLALALVHDGILSPARLAEMMSLNPARLLRLEAGMLSPGTAADVTIIDPEFSWTVEPAKFLSRSRNTPFGGMRLRGKARLTIVGGEIVYDGRGAGRA